MKVPGKTMVSWHWPYRTRKPEHLYRYSPIDEAASEIRLMTLLPGAFGTEVCVTISATTLSESLVPKYEALSYTWGSVAQLEYIYIQDSEAESALAITRNLIEALQYLRYEDRSRVFWIDAICVDQKNISERGHQVVRMADIYRRASRVVIWLGPERDDSTLAMRELDSLGSTVEVDWGICQVKPLSGDDYDKWIEEPVPFVKDRKTLASIDRFVDRSWFKRLWIWQEVRLSNTGALILCGEQSMSWNIFRNAIECLYRKQEPSTKLERLMNICDYDQLPSSLIDLLYYTKYAQCSDERDRVYAIMSLADDVLGLEPDYSKNTEDVFKSVILGSASTVKNLTVLGHCEVRETKKSRLPSWVPDWTVPNKCSPIYGAKACSETEAQARYEEQDSLIVSGCLLATLDVTKEFPRIASFPNSTAQMRRIVRSLVGGRTQDDLYVAGGFMVDAVCRTLCCNRFDESYLPHKKGFSSIEESKRYVRSLMDHRKVVEFERYVNEVSIVAEGRALFQTRSGHIGLGPCSTRPGDQACVVLGCRALLILRSTVKKGYRVVGECYIDGFMESEALLGALPNNWRRIRRHFADVGRGYDAFMNTHTGDIQVEDPRLGPLPAGWCIADHKHKHAYNKFSNEEKKVFATKTDPRLRPEALEARGVKLQEIRLV